MFPVVGALILSRYPGVAWDGSYCLCGLASSVTLVSYAYAERGLVDAPGSLPGALAAAWLSSWIWICGFSPLLTLGILASPTAACLPAGGGRSPPWPVDDRGGRRRGRAASRPLGEPPRPGQSPRRSAARLVAGRNWAGSGCRPPLAILGSFAGLVVRYRRGSAAEREQLRWCVLAVGLLLVSFAIPAAPRSGLSATSSPWALPLLPLSMGAAVLRHRLDDLGVGLRRALVYGWLVAAELTVYVAVVLTLDTALRGQAQPVVALIGAGAVAVLYQPLRLRLQRSTDRMLYGNRGDSYAVLTSLGRRLEAAGSAEQTLPTTAAAVAEALRLPYVAIELPGDPPHRPSVAHGSTPGMNPISIPLTHGGANVGHLVVGRRSPREDLTGAERRLLDDLARQVAVAASSVLFYRALHRSRELLVVAREEERRRLRRDLHDGLGPALAGLALGVDAARNLMPTDQPAAESLLRDLKDETLGCVGEVRRIVEDLRPPTLDQLGLVPALTAFADRLASRDDALQVSLESPDPLARAPGRRRESRRTASPPRP